MTTPTARLGGDRGCSESAAARYEDAHAHDVRHSTEVARYISETTANKFLKPGRRRRNA